MHYAVKRDYERFWKLFASFSLSFEHSKPFKIAALFLLPSKIIISFYLPIKTLRKKISSQKLSHKRKDNKKSVSLFLFVFLIFHLILFSPTLSSICIVQWVENCKTRVKWSSSKMIVNIFIGRIWLETGFIRTHLKKNVAERNEYTHEIMWV